MRNIPVDTEGLSFMAAEDIGPKLKNRDTGEMKTNSKGVPVYELVVMVRREGRRPELFPVSLASATAPNIIAGTPVRLEGLTAFWWETGGRSGVSFSVTAIESVQEPASV